jgi:hypothetical protein
VTWLTLSPGQLAWWADFLSWRVVLRIAARRLRGTVHGAELAAGFWDAEQQFL